MVYIYFLLWTFIQPVEKSNEEGLSQLFLNIKLVLGYRLGILGVHGLVPIYLIFMGEVSPASGLWIPGVYFSG